MWQGAHNIFNKVEIKPLIGIKWQYSKKYTLLVLTLQTYTAWPSPLSEHLYLRIDPALYWDFRFWLFSNEKELCCGPGHSEKNYIVATLLQH